MEPNRRQFTKKALYAVLSVFGLGFLGPAVALFTPRNTRTGDMVYVPLISEDEIPRKGVKKGELVYRVANKERKSRVFIVSSPQALNVFSATCSHLGCLVNYNKEKGEFLCPCHGGRYDLSGKNIAGPPQAPLTSLPVKVERGVVLVAVKV